MPLLGKRTRRQRPPTSPPGPPTSSPVRSSSIPPSSPPKTPIRRLEYAHSTRGNGLPAALLQSHDTSPGIDAIVITSLSTVPFCCHEDLCSMSKSQLVGVAERLNERLPEAMKIQVAIGQRHAGLDKDTDADIDVDTEKEDGHRSKRWIRKEIERIVDIKIPDADKTAQPAPAPVPLGPPLALARIPPSVSEPPLPRPLAALALASPPAAPKANRMRRDSEAERTPHRHHFLHYTDGDTPGRTGSEPRTPLTPTGPATPVRRDRAILSSSILGTSTFTPSQLGTPQLARLDEVDEGRDGNSDSDEGEHGDRPMKKKRKVSVSFHNRDFSSEVDKDKSIDPSTSRSMRNGKGRAEETPRRQRQPQRRHPLSESITHSSSMSSISPHDPEFDDEDDEGEVERLVTSTPTPMPAIPTPGFKQGRTRTRVTRSKTVSLSARTTTTLASVPNWDSPEPGPSFESA